MYNNYKGAVINYQYSDEASTDISFKYISDINADLVEFYSNFTYQSIKLSKEQTKRHITIKLTK
jgi:hypothetical protein